MHSLGMSMSNGQRLFFGQPSALQTFTAGTVGVKMTTQQIVDLLNDALKADTAAIDALIGIRVPCSPALRDHDKIQVRVKNSKLDFPTVGFLGMLNGIAAIDGDRIWADFDEETDVLLRFRAAPISGEAVANDTKTE